MGILTATATATVTATATSNPNRHLSSSLFPLKPYRLLLPVPKTSSRVRVRNPNSIEAYMERNPHSIGSIVNKVIGSLPVWGSSPESSATRAASAVTSSTSPSSGGGLGTSVALRILGLSMSSKIDVAGQKIPCMFFYAVGAGLLKYEEISEAVARLRISNDIEFEEESCLSMMTAAKEKRAKMKASIPEIPMEVRAEKALEAIYICCFGRDPIEEEDILNAMINAVFPTVGKSKIERLVSAICQSG